MSIEVSACFLTAFPQVCQFTPSRRAIADTVVSCRSRLTAHSTARLVSLARGDAKSCSSVQVPRRHEGSGHAVDPDTARWRTRAHPTRAHKNSDGDVENS
jgi:hypothetical protein